MRRIEQGLFDRTPQLHRAAPPAQREPAQAGHTELAICNQTIDEHRIGLKPILHKVWTLTDQRPFAPVEHRYDWRYLVGFVHPASGRTVFHLASAVSIELFEVELAACAQQVGAGPSKQIVLVLDQAGWHTSVHLRVPAHVHLLFLPAYSPELQPAEHLWPLTNTVLANRHFATIDELEDAQAARCVALQRQRELVRSAALFHWWPQRIGRRRGHVGWWDDADSSAPPWSAASRLLSTPTRPRSASARLHRLSAGPDGAVYRPRCASQIATPSRTTPAGRQA